MMEDVKLYWLLRRSITDLVSNEFVFKMNDTLQKRLAACEEERTAAEKTKVEREASAQKILGYQQLLLEAANKKFRWLEQQAQENAKVIKRA